MNPVPDQRTLHRRAADEWRIWLPLILSMLTTLFTIGVAYGALRGELKNIDFRLRTIEKVLKIGP